MNDPAIESGEYGWDMYYFRRICEVGAVDCLQADVSRCGGTPSGCGSRRSASYGLEISGHCLFLTVRRQ